MRLKGYVGLSLVCLFYWIFDSIWSYVSFEDNLKKMIFTEPASYLDTFLLRVSPYQAVSRLMVVTLFVVFGIAIIKFINKKQAAENERRQAEESLQESETKYRSMMESMKDPAYICSPDFHVEYMNPAMINRTGRDATGELCFKTIHNMKKKCPWCMHHKAKQNEYFEHEIVSPKDNCAYHVAISPVVHVDESISVLAVFRDITELKLAEKNVMQSEQRFRGLFESITDLIFTQDLDGRFITVNPAMYKLLGYDINEFIGCMAADFMELEFQSDFKSRYLEVVKKQGFCEGIGCYLKKNGGKIYIDFKSSLVKPDKGEPYISGTGRDVTEKLLSEKKVVKLQQQLSQAQKMESIGTLAGGIAHDFNNILFPIFAHTEMMLMDISQDDPLRESLESVLYSAKRARDLVKQILTFSRQSGQELKPLKTQLVIKEALKLIKSSLPSTIKVIQNIQNDCDFVLADPTQIHQIVMNLCTNAFHAMEKTGGKLKVTLKEVQFDANNLINPNMEPGVYICMIVTDTGEGMNKSTVDRIFDPYFTTKEEGKGTGLGLAVVHGIVKSHGGHIIVYSESGKGTEFSIYLPVIKSQETEQKNKTALSIQKGDERILLVDDEADVVQIGRKILEKLGYHVTVRISSTDALQAFSINPSKFDLVITDLTMPNMTGDKLALALIKIRPDIPVILCTGFSEIMSKSKAESLGIRGFLMKPILIKKLSQKVREILDK